MGWCRVEKKSDGRVVILCGRGGRPTQQRCVHPSCNQPATLLCDFVGERVPPKTCDRPTCRIHATRVGDNQDYCYAHF